MAEVWQQTSYDVDDASVVQPAVMRRIRRLEDLANGLNTDMLDGALLDEIVAETLQRPAREGKTQAARVGVGDSEDAPAFLLAKEPGAAR